MAPIVNTNSTLYPSSYSLEVEKKLWDSYMPNYRLGEGSYGFVIAATRISDQLPVAIKVVIADKVKFTTAPYQGIQRRYPVEVLALDTARNIEGVVKLLQWCDCGDKVIIVMERPQNSIDLTEYLDTRGHLDEISARTVMRQIVKTTHELMNLGLMHRDLKAENILLDLVTLEVKLIDFGLIAKVSSTSTMITTRVGTASHFPPELLSSNQFSADAGNVWAMGIILHQILLGYLPFQDEKEILRGHFYTPPQLSLKGQDFLQLCLKQNPNLRPSLSQLMSHSWINPYSQSLPDSNAIEHASLLNPQIQYSNCPSHIQTKFPKLY